MDTRLPSHNRRWRTQCPVIKNGTIVTADRTYKADVLIEGGKIIDDRAGPCTATRCSTPPAATSCRAASTRTPISKCRSWAPTRPTISRAAPRAALSGGTTMVVDFCLPAPGQSLLEALQMWDNKAAQGRLPTIPSTWRSPGGAKQVFDEMATVVDARHHHLQAFHGLQGRADGERRRDVRLVPALRRARRAAAGPCRERRRRRRAAAEAAWPRAITGPEGHAYSRPPEVEGEATNRAIMIADMAGVPLYVVHVSCEQAHEAIRRARAEGHARLWRAADPAPDARRERIFQQGLGPCGAPRDVAALPQQAAPGLACGPGLQSGSLQVVATDHCAFTTEQKRIGLGDFTKIPNGTGGLEDRMPVLWTTGVDTGRLTHERVRRRDLDQHRQDPQHLSEEGRDRWPAPTPTSSSGTRSARRPSRAKTQQSVIDYNVFEGFEVDRPAALHAVARRGRDRRGQGRRPSQGHGQFVAREPNTAVNRALSTWKEITAPRKVERTGIPASGV